MAEEVTLPAPLMVLAEGRYRIERSAHLTIKWTEPGKRNPKEMLERSDIYVKALHLTKDDERKVVLKVSGAFWSDFQQQARLIDSIAKKYRDGAYDPREWVVTVNAERRIENIG